MIIICYLIWLNGLIEQYLVAGNVTRISNVTTWTLNVCFSNTNYDVVGKGMRGGSSNYDFDLIVDDVNKFHVSGAVYAYNFLCIGY